MNKHEEKRRKLKKSNEKWRKMTNNGLQNNDFYPHAIWDAWYTHTQMAHGKKFWFCSHFFPLFSFFFIFLQNPTRRNMKKSEENEEKWRKLEKSGYKTKKSIHMPSETPGTHTHTQMAHGKKSWFCSNFSSLFCFYSFFSTMLKSGEKWRKVKTTWRKQEGNVHGERRLWGFAIIHPQI